MLKEALRYLMEDMSIVNMKEINGEYFADRPMNRISYNPKASPISLNTLSSLIDYIKAGVDEMHGKMVIHVQSPTKVQFYSSLDNERKRECIAEVTALVPDFRFGQFYDHESFCIGLQSKFVDDPTTDRALLLKFAGTVEAGTVAEYGDDGITQKATVKTGIASKGEAIIPNPAKLKPFRTFIEVDQPESCFIFRMKDHGGIQCALFEADGGAWKLDAMTAIHDFLEENLKDIKNIVVIS